MKINGMSSVSIQPESMKMSQTHSGDIVTKNIQTQIANEQQKLKNLSYDKEMSMEEKAKKRQEIQKEISELNRELRQHQIEQRKEQQEKQASSMKETLSGGQEESVLKNTEEKSTIQESGLSKNHMKAIITADAKLSQADVQRDVEMQAEHRIKVLDIEIQQDRMRGADVETKKEEREKLQDIAINAAASQVGILYHANEEIGEATKKDYQEHITGKKQTQQIQQDTERKRIKISFD